jgi:hypothetical protein
MQGRPRTPNSYEFLTAEVAVPGRVLIRKGPIIGVGAQGALMKRETVMTDLIYIGGGVAVLLIYALYAVALRKV